MNFHRSLIQLPIVNFSYQKLKIKMIRSTKQQKKTKATSSYLLSGFNIKKIVAEQMSSIDQNNIVSDVNMSKGTRRPLTKINNKEREENNGSSNLPNKSFKIRSFTKKLRQIVNANKNDENYDIFERVDYVRNLRAVNNRAEMFNFSRISHHEKNKKEGERGVTANIYSKMREVFKKDASVKCKVGSQIFVQENVARQDNQPTNIPLTHQNIDLEKYRQIGNKIHVHYNQQSSNDQEVLLIVSLQALHMHKKRCYKSEDAIRQQKMGGIVGSLQTQQILRQICSENINSFAKIAFKVPDSNYLSDLRTFLESNHLQYYCIFYPIVKFVEPWNFYLIDSIVKNTQEIIVVQHRYNIRHELPVINDQLRTIFVTTYNETFNSLRKIFQVFGYYFKYKNQGCNAQSEQKQSEKNKVQPLNEKDEPEPKVEAGHWNFSSDKLCVLSCDFNSKSIESLKNTKQGQQKKVATISSHGFNIKSQMLSLNAFKLGKYFDFIMESRQIKNQKQRKSHSKNKNNTHEGKRRVLCQRSPNINISEFNINSNEDPTSDKHHKQTAKGINEVGQELLQHAKEIMPKNWRIFASKSQKNENGSNQGLEDVMSHIKGSAYENKTISQHISELIKKNTNIFKQIDQYVQNNKHINIPESSSLAKQNQIQDISLRLFKIN